MNRKGISTTSNAWVVKSLLREYEDLNENVEVAKRKLASYLALTYEDSWRERFDGKARKATWSELTQAGESYPSLSTFYSHVRDLGLEKVLRSYLAYSSVGTVVDILNINDLTIASFVSEIKEMERTIAKQERKLVRTGFV